MKHNREAELIACCQSIIRNAPDIMKNYRHDQEWTISISISQTSLPSVTITKTVVPEEVISVYTDDRLRDE